MRLGREAVGERGERAIVSAMKTGKRRTHDVTIVLKRWTSIIITRFIIIIVIIIIIRNNGIHFGLQSCSGPLCYLSLLLIIQSVSSVRLSFGQLVKRWPTGLAVQAPITTRGRSSRS